MTRLGRAVEQEVSALEAGMDFRSPALRREVFLRFYEFHLRYRSHPGAVYYVMPFLAKKYGWDQEAKLWFAFLNGNTQHPVTSLAVFSEFPSPRGLDRHRLATWFGANYDALEFDTDRRYHKKDFLASVSNYAELVGSRPQAEFFGRFCSASDPRANFRSLWPVLRKHFHTFGRLSAFSYAEYLAVMGLPIECDSLFLDDLSGSKSHRNGLCKVLGRDDLDWHDSNPAFDGRYGATVIGWLREEADALLSEARQRMRGRPGSEDVGFFTLESALCTYKSWHRPNRRYPNVYNDLFHDRIKKSERRLGRPQPVFWEAREKSLPAHLLLEKTPADPGCVPAKQNHYLRTGQVIMMHRDWPCFENDFNRRTDP